jgi:hypothetical protein
VIVGPRCRAAVSAGREDAGAQDSFTLTTDLGSLDLLATPAGTDGFDDLARTAESLELFGHGVLVASVDDLIRMKRAAGRPKDLLAVEELAALRDELDASAPV